MKARASKVGVGGLRPLQNEDIGGTKVDDLMLQQRGRKRRGKNKEVSNGSVAAPIKGTKVSDATSITGGSL